MTAALRNRLWLLAAVGITAAKLWLTHAQGIFAIGSAGHDDRLFLELAQHLAHGDWLGPYNELTLAKGPFYSLFIAVTFLAGIPLFAAQQLFYAGACAAFVRALRPAVASSGLRFLIYAFLLWNPMTYDAPSMGRVLRQQLYGPLALMILAGLIALALRHREPARRQWPWAVLAGVAAGCFYLTREESLWFVPSVLLLGSAVVYFAWEVGRGALLRSTTMLALATATAVVPVLSVSAMNLRHYGWFGICEFHAREFKDAYGAMLRVRVGPELPYVPITREARVAMAAVSPAFAELQRQFDRGIARGWAGAGSSLTNLPAEQEQIAGGWMMWAFRECTALAGHAHSAGEAMAFYAKLALEINRACDEGRLPAGPRRSGFMPAWREEQTPRFVRATRDFADFVIRFSRFSAKPPPSTGSPEELQLFGELTHERLSPPEEAGSERDAPRASNRAWEIEALHGIGKVLRQVLMVLFWVAQLSCVARLGWLLWQRRWPTYPLLVAGAAWGACVASLLIHAMIEATSFPVLTISSFAPIYPLVLVFIFAVFWDLAAAWAQRGECASAVATTAPLPALQTAPGWLLGGVGLVALVPFLIWHASFRELVWFADDFFLLDQLSILGFNAWCFSPFAENFVPLFKALWAAVIFGFEGSYFAMLGVLWLTHALNAALLALALIRAGTSRSLTIITVLCFALTPANVETLGWSVQWSAMLATSFLLLGLCWLLKRGEQEPDWRGVVTLTLLSAASACCFSRGVLTGIIFGFGFLLPALLKADWAGVLRRLPGAAWCALPSLLVTWAIKQGASGNHQQLMGHLGDIIEFSVSFFLLNPGQNLSGGVMLSPFVILLLAGAKLAVIVAALWLAQGRARGWLLLLLACDVGNALLVGLGRYHTGFFAAMSSRYQYSSLITTLPFAAVVADYLLGWVKLPVWRHGLAAALIVFMAGWCLRGWPAELKDFCRWRGTELRALLAAPATNDPTVRVPALEFMHIERAKALQRTYQLH